MRARDKAHGRRAFFKALNDEPTGVGEALEQIKALYAVEDQIRDLKLCGEAKQLHRLTHSKLWSSASSSGWISSLSDKTSHRATGTSRL